VEGSGAMRSIDNLREYALTAASVNATTRAVLAGYVDEIEREVEELRDRDYRNGREDAKGAVEFADRLKAAVDNREDVTLFGVDYTALPVDADGVPIHVGERVTCVLPFGGESEPFVVDRMELGRDGDGDVWSVALDRPTSCWEQPLLLRHHHAPTVEDMLREFYVLAVRGKEAHAEDVDADVLTEYAAKLRLKEG